MRKSPFNNGFVCFAYRLTCRAVASCLSLPSILIVNAVGLTLCAALPPQRRAICTVRCALETVCVCGWLPSLPRSSTCLCCEIVGGHLPALPATAAVQAHQCWQARYTTTAERSRFGSQDETDGRIDRSSDCADILFGIPVSSPLSCASLPLLLDRWGLRRTVLDVRKPSVSETFCWARMVMPLSMCPTLTRVISFDRS